MKTRKFRVITGFVVVMLMLTVLATTALAFSDFYESTYNYKYFACRSTCTKDYSQAKINCQEPSYLLAATMTYTIDTLGDRSTTTEKATGYSVADMHRTADVSDFISASFRYTIQGQTVYSVPLSA
jgi:hypothetical protein